MADVSSNWQDSLNTGLVNRLNRPLNQPGMMKMSMSQRIINRCDRLLNRLPLLGQQMQRWGNVNTAVSQDVPIVYAQPISASNQSSLESTEQNVQPTVPVIQRKEKPIDNITSSLTLENQVNQTSISSSQIPVVSSQAISEQIAESEEMPLLQEFRSTSQQLPIVQIEQQNSDLLSSQLPVIPHLPVTNPLNTFTASKQTQVEKNYESIHYSKQENLVTDISLTNLPIVTNQAATSQNNSNPQNNQNLPLISITNSIKTPEKNQPLH